MENSVRASRDLMRRENGESQNLKIRKQWCCVRERARGFAFANCNKIAHAQAQAQQRLFKNNNIIIK